MRVSTSRRDLPASRWNCFAVTAQMQALFGIEMIDMKVIAP